MWSKENIDIFFSFQKKYFSKLLQACSKLLEFLA